MTSSVEGSIQSSKLSILENAPFDENIKSKISPPGDVSTDESSNNSSTIANFVPTNQSVSSNSSVITNLSTVDNGPTDESTNSNSSIVDDLSTSGSINREVSITNHVSTEKSANILSWRLDPRKSFSDWTIEIVPIVVSKKDTWLLLSDDDSSKDFQNTVQAQVEVFHVNRNILAFGEHKSEYFAVLFSKFSPGDQNLTQIEILPFVMKYIPQFLDFLYGHFTAGNITVDNAVALRHLGGRFDVSTLYRYADEYIRASLKSIENCIKLVNEVDKFDDKQLMQTITDACASQYTTGSRDQFISLMPLLFTKVMTSQTLKCESGELSVVLMVYIESHKDKICNLFTEDEVHFQQLTCCERMPIVDFEPALYFLREQLISNDVSEGKSSCNADKSLYLRCIESIAQHWNGLDIGDVQRDIEQMPMKTQLDVRTAALREGVTKMSDCDASLKEATLKSQICDDALDEVRLKLEKLEKDVEVATENLIKREMALKEAKKKISDQEKEQNELSAYVTKDIEDSRVLKSLGIIRADPATLRGGTIDIMEIRVCGAAIKGANGVYILTGECNGHPKYQKGALIDGKNEVFSFYAAKMRNSNEIKWWISSMTQSAWYYVAGFTPGSNGEAAEPPSDDQWKVASHGKNPKPFVTIIRASD